MVDISILSFFVHIVSSFDLQLLDIVKIVRHGTDANQNMLVVIWKPSTCLYWVTEL